jgi:hypothetical protein
MQKTNEVITVGNGTHEAAKGVGNIYGMATDKCGNDVGPVVLTEVTLLPTAAFNLFSLTKMIEKGWILHGNDDMIWLDKGDKTVKFDIKIKTSRGVLFCMNIKRTVKSAEELAMANANTQEEDEYPGVA